MLRKLIGNFRKSMSERVAPRRYAYQVPVIVSFDPLKNSGRKNQAGTILSVRGETKDLSSTGIAFIVPSIRLREYYLVGENRPLDIEMKLPEGKVKMQVVGQRYEQLGDEHTSMTGYMIGAVITQMSDDDRQLYDGFLRLGCKTKVSAGKLELGVDKS